MDMIKIVYITEKGKNIARKIEDILKYYRYSSSTCHLKDLQIEGVEKGFIFIMAVGIVIRKCIDKIKNDKTRDPFVIVVDENGEYIIPLLSNHLGGGNYFSRLLEGELGGKAVLTTATDTNNKVGIDELSRMYFLETPKKKDILRINRKVLEEKVDLYLPRNWKVIDRRIENTYNVHYHNRDYIVVDDIILPKKYVVVGLGCRKGIETWKVYWTVKKALYIRNIPPWRVDGFATIDIKERENGILESVRKFKGKLYTFTKKEIMKIYKIRNDLEKSPFVFKSLGVYGVSEPVSILGVSKLRGENIDPRDVVLILKKFKNNGVTVSIGAG
ncbi:cobalt-precorrin 5A hydrolase [Methanofervidicoccus abyssi]|uniref:Cobalt-precorrin 5A hydrolase n=2 Tax=Methanofervidicoccus abyssi TaxID=2082189 RepID=A0A401HR77_9EURY|nr:cobalt-precorrin 5A hydrolase [Methanofervidicoccus abyssi]